VFHCSEGKDRTGWVAILLQCLAGVSDHDILADYLLTNELMRGGGDTRSLARVVFGDMPDDFFAPAMIADTAYLKAGMTQLEADYGTVEGYLLGGLGLSEDHLERLRTLLIR
jgi:protein-tyrosine phosphatase